LLKYLSRMRSHADRTQGKANFEANSCSYS
jgi:hypothetical protein